MSVSEGDFIYGNVEKTLEIIRKTINADRNKTHGNPLLWARTFIIMLDTFLIARRETGVGLHPADAFTIMSIMKQARTAVGPIPLFDTAMDTAGYDVLRAAWLLPPEPVEQPVPTPPEPTIDELREQARQILAKVRALGGEPALNEQTLNKDDLAANRPSGFVRAQTIGEANNALSGRTMPPEGAQSMELMAGGAPKDPEPQPDTAGTAGAAGEAPEGFHDWHTDPAGPEAPAKVG